MVNEVTAFQASDGTVFASHGEAARHEAFNQLKLLALFKPETITAIVNNAPAIIEALSSLLDDPEA